MFKNYLKIALRNLFKNRVYSLINIIGLTTGLTACLLVATVVIDELSYDRFWKNGENVYRVLEIDNEKDYEEKGSRTSSGLAPNLKKNFPEVKAYCRMDVWSDRIKLTSNNEGVDLRLLRCEPSVWDVLDFNIVHGNPKRFIEGYKNLVITKGMQQEYFPGEDPIGKIVKNLPTFGETDSLIITGIIDHFPSNTHLRSDALVIEKLEPELYDKLHSDGAATFLTQYVLLSEGVNHSSLTGKINKWYQTDVLNQKSNTAFEFQPISNVYLRSEFEQSTVQGNLRNVYIFSAVSFLLLAIACINFINLTTARALKRMREVGVRKVLGADRKNLITQCLFESFLFFFISFALSFGLYHFFLEALQGYLGHELVVTLSGNLTMLIITCLLVLATSLATGLYPAILATRPKVVNIMKGRLSETSDSTWLRKSLITAQFVISIIIIISTVVVRNQISFIGKKDLGYRKDNLLQLGFTSWDGKGPAFKEALLSIRGVEGASMTHWYPTNGKGSRSVQFPDPLTPDSKVKVNYISGDQDLSSVLQVQLKYGRLLDNKLQTDSRISDSIQKKLIAKNKVLLTEYTAKRFNVLELNKSSRGIDGIPVGIIKDLHSETLRFGLTPTVIETDNEQNYGFMLIRVQSGFNNLKTIADLYREFYPNKAFAFSWIDHLVDEQYRGEYKLQQLFVFFSFLIIFLACLGLFGLVTFTVQQRVKEIGIRKVLGASVTQISYLISKDFLRLVFIAFIIAAPMAWFAMNKWLEDFAYRIEIQWWMLVLAGIMASLIALITVSLQAVKAAVANPVKSLRAE